MFLSVPVCWSTFYTNKMELLLDLLDLGTVFHVPKSTLHCQNLSVLAPGICVCACVCTCDCVFVCMYV